MFNKTGLASNDMVEALLPSKERREKGAYAIFECFQEIPCNPCSTVCKLKAVKDFENINNIPEINYDKCTGCAMCVSICPGLSCFVIDETYSDSEVMIKMPYEFLPLPEINSNVKALDREGKAIGEAKVLKVQDSKALDHTNIVTISVPKEIFLDVRNIGLEEK
jgi:Fe-S-cluster-containing hydrogenase component 2